MAGLVKLHRSAQVPNEWGIWAGTASWPDQREGPQSPRLNLWKRLRREHGLNFVAQRGFE